MHPPRPLADYDTLAWAQLALGAGWNVPACGGTSSSASQPGAAAAAAGGRRRRLRQATRAAAQRPAVLSIPSPGGAQGQATTINAANIATGSAAGAPLALDVCAQPSAAGDLSLAALLANTSTLSLQGRAALALALGVADASPPAPPSPNAAATAVPANAAAVRKGLVQGMLSAMRVSGRSAYVAAGQGEAGAAGLDAQALAQLALLQARRRLYLRLHS